MKLRSEFVGEMRHVALLGKTSEGSPHKTHGIGVGDFEGGVKGFVSYQAIGVEMFAVPGNSVVWNHVDGIDNGVLCGCFYKEESFLLTTESAFTGLSAKANAVRTMISNKNRMARI